MLSHSTIISLGLQPDELKNATLKSKLNNYTIIILLVLVSINK